MRRLAPLLLACVAPALAQTPAISVETLKSVDQELSSDAYEGRAPTTPGETKSVGYIIKRFQEAGLKPGPQGWTQDVPMVEIAAEHVAPFTFTGGPGSKGAPVTMAYGTDMVAATYRVEPHIALTNSPVLFVGYGITAPEKGWDDYAGVDVRGKTVVILVNDPDWQSTARTGLFDGRAMTYYGRWTYKYENAARHGAAAAIIVHDTEPAAYPWAVVNSSWTGAKYELDEPGGYADQSQVIGWMQLAKAHELFASAGQDFDRLQAAAKVKGFRAVPLDVTLSTGFDNRLRHALSHNVIGVLPGTTRPGEAVLYSAHWDHLGHCAPVSGDGICNGALDNASGVAGLVALAEAQVKAGPAKRSLVFLAVTAEEQGLLGSAWYAAHPLYPLATTAGGVNMDVLSVRGRARDFEITGAGKSEIEAMVRPFLAAQGRMISPEPNPERGGYYRSDHFSFAKLGVPMLDGGSGQDLRVGGVAVGHAAAEDYVAHRYHKPQDEYDPAWDWSGAVEDLTVYYQLGRQLADTPGLWPNWFKTAEFRAVRDADHPEARR